MSPHRMVELSGIRRCVPLFCAAVALLFGGAARADFLIAVSSATAAIGSSGNTLEVELTNTGASAVTFGGFAFGISTLSLDITFTAAITATTATYIFATDSLFGPDIATNTGLSLTAADASALGSDSVAAGTTVGLGRVSFDVASGATLGPVTVTLAGFPTTSLSDGLGNNLAFTSSNGTILVTSPSVGVSEPSTLLLISTGRALLAVRASGCRRLRFDAKR